MTGNLITNDESEAMKLATMALIEHYLLNFDAYLKPGCLEYFERLGASTQGINNVIEGMIEAGSVRVELDSLGLRLLMVI